MSPQVTDVLDGEIGSTSEDWQAGGTFVTCSGARRISTPTHFVVVDSRGVYGTAVVEGGPVQLDSRDACGGFEFHWLAIPALDRPAALRGLGTPSVAIAPASACAAGCRIVFPPDLGLNAGPSPVGPSIHPQGDWVTRWAVDLDGDGAPDLRERRRWLQGDVGSAEIETVVEARSADDWTTVERAVHSPDAVPDGVGE